MAPLAAIPRGIGPPAVPVSRRRCRFEEHEDAAVARVHIVRAGQLVAAPVAKRDPSALVAVSFDGRNVRELHVELHVVRASVQVLPRPLLVRVPADPPLDLCARPVRDHTVQGAAPVEVSVSRRFEPGVHPQPPEVVPVHLDDAEPRIGDPDRPAIPPDVGLLVAGHERTTEVEPLPGREGHPCSPEPGLHRVDLVEGNPSGIAAVVPTEKPIRPQHRRAAPTDEPGEGAPEPVLDRPADPCGRGHGPRRSGAEIDPRQISSRHRDLSLGGVVHGDPHPHPVPGPLAAGRGNAHTGRRQGHAAAALARRAADIQGRRLCRRAPHDLHPPVVVPHERREVPETDARAHLVRELSMPLLPRDAVSPHLHGAERRPAVVHRLNPGAVVLVGYPAAARQHVPPAGRALPPAELQESFVLLPVGGDDAPPDPIVGLGVQPGRASEREEKRGEHEPERYGRRTGGKHGRGGGRGRGTHVFGPTRLSAPRFRATPSDPHGSLRSGTRSRSPLGRTHARIATLTTSVHHHLHRQEFQECACAI